MTLEQNQIQMYACIKHTTTFSNFLCYLNRLDDCYHTSPCICCLVYKRVIKVLKKPCWCKKISIKSQGKATTLGWGWKAVLSIKNGSGVLPAARSLGSLPFSRHDWEPFPDKSKTNIYHIVNKQYKLICSVSLCNKFTWLYIINVKYSKNHSIWSLTKDIYRRLSLSRTRLFRITANLKVKI